MRFARSGAASGGAAAAGGRHHDDAGASLPSHTGMRGAFKQCLVNKMLNLVASSYKIVIVDEHGARIMNEVFRMSSLMDYGVTLVQQIADKRQPVKVSDALYFVSPTNENCDVLVRDVKGGLYKSFHLFVISEMSDAMLGRLAGAQIADKLASFVDLHLDFSAPEALSFNIGMPYDIPKLFGDTASRDAMSAAAERIFDVLRAADEVPAVRFQDSPVARFVGTKLQALLDDKASDADASTKTGTIIVVDRSVDTITPVLHELTYEAMLADLHPMKDGLVQLGSGSQKHAVPLDAEDPLWCELRHAHIADVTRKCREKLDALKQEYPQLASWDPKAGDVSLRQIGDAVRNLPQFKQQQMRISVHAEIASLLMRRYEEERLEPIVECEQRIASLVDDRGSKLSAKDCVKEAEKALKDSTLTPNVRTRILLALGVSAGVSEAAKLTRGSTPSALEALGRFEPSAKYKTERTRADRHPAYDSSRYVPFMKSLMEDATTGGLDEHAFPYAKTPPAGHGAATAAAVAHAGGGGGFGTRSHAAEEPEKKSRFGGLFGRSRQAHSSSADAASSSRSGGATSGSSGPRGRPVARLDLGHGNTVDLVSKGRIWFFVVGGVAPSEVRCAYEVTRATGHEVVIGGTSQLRPDAFVGDLEILS